MLEAGHANLEFVGWCADVDRLANAVLFKLIRGGGLDATCRRASPESNPGRARSLAIQKRRRSKRKPAWEFLLSGYVPLFPR
jgi:hypothetical protein